MKKIAIFVEGQSERLFVVWLLKNLLSDRIYTIEEFGYRSGSLVQIEVPHSRPGGNSEGIYIQVTESCGDAGVVSRIKERSLKLAENKFYRIFGLRDLHPKPLALFDYVYNGINNEVRRSTVPAKVFLAVHELEAWFIADESCLLSIDSSLVPDKVKDIINYHHHRDDIETYECSAELLGRLAQEVGKSYIKRKSQVEDLLASMDFDRFWNITRLRVPRLNAFTSEIEAAIV